MLIGGALCGSPSLWALRSPAWPWHEPWGQWWLLVRARPPGATHSPWAGTGKARHSLLTPLEARAELHWLQAGGDPENTTRLTP